jgi:hypothetical protein
MSGQMYKTSSCVEVCLINEQLSLAEVVSNAGPPEWESRKYRWALMTGIFVDLPAARSTEMEIKTKLEEIGKINKFEFTNITIGIDSMFLKFSTCSRNFQFFIADG